MTLSSALQAASDSLAIIENESVPTPYNRPEISALTSALRNVLNEVATVEAAGGILGVGLNSINVIGQAAYTALSTKAATTLYLIQGA